MAGYTKKIMAQHSQATLDSLISCVSPLPRTILPLLSRMLSEKNMQIRTYVSTHLKHYLEVNGLKAKSSLEAGGQVDVLELMLKKGLIDANPAVREVSRITFWSFHAVWPQRADALLATLDATNRKMVAKACPNPNTFGTKSSDAAASGPKKSSLAEQIAASRAKARQIATAPPSLIHQATSTSHIQASSKLSSPPIRAPSPSLSSKSSDGGPSSARPHGSPPKLGRIVSNGFKPTSSSAPRPRTPTQPSPPHSPRGLTTDVSKRTHSTKLVPTTPERDRTAAMRRAITTPLPASPPQPATVVTPPTPRVAVIPRQRAPQSSITALLTHPPQAHIRTSSVMPHMDDDQSLLLASSVPIPEDDYSGMDMDMDETQQSIDITASGMGNPLVLSTSTRPRSNSNSLSNGSNTQAFSFSPKSDMSFLPAQSNSLSSRSRGSSGPVVEDALRARAEQAESAAERLLELVDPEEQGQFTTVNRNGNGHVANGGSPKSGKILLRKPVGGFAPAPSRQPVTPARTSVLRQAAQFQDTPNMKRGTSSMMDALKDHQNQSGWWLKRMKRESSLG
jgi:CLIP-associating protein 1/2